MKEIVFICSLVFVIVSVIILFTLVWYSRYLQLHRREKPQISIDVTNEVVISLTTIPSRLSKIIPTIHSLLDQTISVPIHLFLPRRAKCEPDVQYTIPKGLDKLITIHVEDSDSGPSMKFLPAMKHLVNTTIIVVDDDVIYPRKLVEQLYFASLVLPDAVSCTRGWKLPPDLRWEKTRTKFSHQLSTHQPVAVVTGCGGYVLPPKVIQKFLVNGGIWNYNGAPKSATLMDDIWISGWLSRLGIAKYVVPGIKRFHSNMFSWFTPRHLSLQRKQRNNEVIQFFNKDWKQDEIQMQ